MRTFFVLILLMAGAAYAFRRQLDSFVSKATWRNADGETLWDQLTKEIGDLYGGDLLGDGRDHSDKIQALEAAGAVTFEDPGDNISNGGALINGVFVDADPGTRQYLAQTECAIAVRDFGMAQSELQACVTSVANRGRYGFTSDGVRMMVDIVGGSTSGLQAQYTGTVETGGSSNNWEEITEG